MNYFKVLLMLLSFISLNMILMTNTYADNSVNTIQTQNNKNTGEYVRKRFLAFMNKPFELSDQNKSKPKILIIGDSHAQDFVNAIAENKLLKNSQIRTRYIPTRCQIYLGDKSNRDWLKSDNQLCGKSDNLALAKTQIANADVIILAALWRKWAAVQLPQTLKNLKLSTNQKVFVIGRRSFLGLDKKSISKRSEVDIHQLDINKIMNETLAEHVFINVHKLVCGTGTNCPIFTDRSRLISQDGGHLSQDGARYLGEILFEKTQLSQFVKRVDQ